MKAIVKVRIAVTLLSEEGDPPMEAADVPDKHDLVYANEGVLRPTDKIAATGYLGSLVTILSPSLARLVPLKGDHKPDLALARGGDQEP